MNSQGSMMLLLATTVSCAGVIPNDELGEITDSLQQCVTLGFETSASQPLTYIEGEYSVTSLYPDPSAHVHLLGSTLYNHSDCCSTPYQIARQDGEPFTVQTVDVVSLSGTHQMTASNGTTFSLPNQPSVAFPSGFSNITSFLWSAGGPGTIDNLKVCHDVTLPTQQQFSYDRIAAATTAWGLAQYVESNNTLPPTVPLLNENSAQLISLSLFAGGFPMFRFVYHNTANTNRNLGWYATVRYSQVHGQPNAWNVHNSSLPIPDPRSDSRLIGYVSGSTESGGSIILYDRGVRYKKVPAFDVYTDTNKLSRAIAAIRRAGIDTGDYLFIDAEAGHGAIVIGWGPAVHCNSLELLNATYVRSSSSTLDVKVPGTPTRLVKRKGEPIDDVPYIADWSLAGSGNPNPGITQLQTARPFYCTNQQMTVPTTRSFFSHHYWIFYALPNGGTFSTMGSFSDRSKDLFDYSYIPSSSAGFRVSASGVTIP